MAERKTAKPARPRGAKSVQRMGAMRVEVPFPKGVTEEKLDALAQELVEPLQQQLVTTDLSGLKTTYGKKIGTIKIHSLNERLVGHLGAAGYESKLWEKACC